MTKVMVSGGFDPLHVGHLDLLENAAKFGKVIAVVMPDEWLLRKKGHCVMKQEDRKDIVLALDWVYQAFIAENDSDTICHALSAYRPDMFLNGGDRIESNPEEHDMCVKLGIVEGFGCGGAKIRSSSEIAEGIKQS